MKLDPNSKIYSEVENFLYDAGSTTNPKLGEAAYQNITETIKDIVGVFIEKGRIGVI